MGAAAKITFDTQRVLPTLFTEITRRFDPIPEISPRFWGNIKCHYVENKVTQISKLASRAVSHYHVSVSGKSLELLPTAMVNSPSGMTQF